MKWVNNYMIVANSTSAWSLGTLNATGLVTAQGLNRSKGQEEAELIPARNWIFTAQTEEQAGEERETGFPTQGAGFPTHTSRSRNTVQTLEFRDRGQLKGWGPCLWLSG